LSQVALASGGISPSYVSLLEAGKRVPTRAVVGQLADRLGCAPEELLGPAEDRTPLELELNYAQLALSSGEPIAALRRFTELLDVPAVRADPLLAERARYGQAAALEATGDLEAAITVFEQLREQSVTAGRYLAWARVLVALTRCYREVGDLALSIERGEAALLQISERSLVGTDVHAELVSSLVASYHARGDLTRAASMARDLIDYVEQGDSRRARGAAYWNAAIIAGDQGQHADALALAQRALAMYAESEDERSLARLRLMYAWLLLRTDPPEAAQARELLVKAQSQLREVGSDIDVAYCDTELSRAELALGNTTGAMEHAQAALTRLGGPSRLETARARLALGQAHLAQGESDQAIVEFRAAAEQLADAGVTREAAACWRELAETLMAIGDAAAAHEAYARALDLVGIRTLRAAGSALSTATSGAIGPAPDRL